MHTPRHPGQGMLVAAPSWAGSPTAFLWMTDSPPPIQVARVDIATPSRVTCPPWVGATGFWEEETPDEAPLPPAGLHTSIPPLGRGNAADRGHVRTCALSQGPRVPLRSCAHPTSLQDQKEQIKNITTCSTVCEYLKPPNCTLKDG